MAAAAAAETEERKKLQRGARAERAKRPHSSREKKIYHRFAEGRERGEEVYITYRDVLS